MPNQKATLRTAEVCPTKVPPGLPHSADAVTHPFICQSQTVPSIDPEANNIPFGEKATLDTVI